MPVRETANGFISTLPYQLGTGGGIMRSLSLIKLNYLLLYTATKTFTLSSEYKMYRGLLPATATGYLEPAQVAESLRWQQLRRMEFWANCFCSNGVPVRFRDCAASQNTSLCGTGGTQRGPPRLHRVLRTTNFSQC